jgi:hypothetical protein
MTMDKAILAVTDKNYKEFEKSVADILSDKMKNSLAGFVSYLDKQTFKKGE